MSACKAQQPAYASIMRCIKEVVFNSDPAVPCPLILSGDHAFPLVMNSKGEVLMAASTYGSGRIIVFGHELYLFTSPDLLKNAVNWLRGDGSDNMSVGLHIYTRAKEVADFLSNSGFQVKVMGDFSSDQGIGVYVTDAYDVEKDEKNIVAFMKAGGGVLIAGQAWHWSHTHPKGNTLLEFAGNKVSGVAGIHFTNHYGEKERVSILPVIPFSWKAAKLIYDFKEDLKVLLQGVSQFDLQGDALASEILVHGCLSFPIGSTEDGREFLAGGYYGKGRVVVVAHETFLGEESWTGFWDNVVHWLDQGRQGVVGVEPHYALNILKKSGLKCEQTGFRKDLSVFVCTVYSGNHIKEIQEFVAEGGGLLIGGHAWYWAQSHPGKNYLTESPGNKILNPMGLSLLSGTIGGGVYKAPDTNISIKETYHFCHLLFRFAGHLIDNKGLTPHEEKCLQKLRHHYACFLQTENYDSCSYQQIVSILTDIFKKMGLPQVSESSPAKTPKDHFLLRIAAKVYKVCPNQDELLGYLFKNNPVLPTVKDQRININVNTGEGKEWVSTGLYLSPGMKTYMSIPADIVNKGWKVQISCQTDKLRHEELKRAPCVHERFPVTSEMMQVHNLWGGLIYLIAPPHTEVTGVEVIVQMAVPTPYYKSGVTSLSDWQLLRTAPSPWAELEFENIILTVPSDVVRSLDRPDELAAHWDKIMGAMADLAAIPHKFKRKERIVCDVQISAGWMHAGYPVMAHRASAVDVVTVEHRENKDMWGPIHELGHNQQRGSWEFPPHTCNLRSVYVHETVLNIPREEAHGDMTLAKRNSRIMKYIKEGRKLSNWTVWVALETYLQLQEKFGWDAFKKVFAAYHTMKDVPNDNKGKMNLYTVTFSQAVGMDLTGFFKSWGWPIEADTEKKLSNLPAWTDHPMTKYN